MPFAAWTERVPTVRCLPVIQRSLMMRSRLFATWSFPNGSWQIATAPVDGWVSSHPQALVVHLVTTLFVSMAVLAVVNKVKQDAAVRTSEERLRDVTDSSSDLVWEVDTAGTITYLSGHAERVLGVAAGNLLGTSIFGYADGDDHGAAKKTFDAAVRAGLELKDEEVWIASVDGERRCLLRNGRPLIDVNGVIVGYRGVDKDITTRKASGSGGTRHGDQVGPLLSAVVGRFFLHDVG